MPEPSASKRRRAVVARAPCSGRRNQRHFAARSNRAPLCSNRCCWWSYHAVLLGSSRRPAIELCGRSRSAHHITLMSRVGTARAPLPENRSANVRCRSAAVSSARRARSALVGSRAACFEMWPWSQRAVGLGRVARGLLRDVALEPSRAPRQAHEVNVDLRADAQRLAAVGRADEPGQVARGGQRCHCFSRNASFIRTVFCEYTLYFFCCFFCDFLLFLLVLSPFFGILAGRQRVPAVAGRMHAGAAVLSLPSPRALRFRQPLVLLLTWRAGWRMFCRRRAAKGRLACSTRGC
mmetsp:Transcript_7054/g.18235  ORF Transcript_7054/g.18235 Transcript_7054/m.18235 type:complete len:293 (-) Transcript_7054:225-1103(-)